MNHPALALPPADTAPASLTPLQELTHADMRRVNALILELAGSRAGLIPAISEHLISSGGKRLRPMLTLACSHLCGYEGSHHIHLAASVEFIHSATLLHDDVVDESLLRRGLATANDVWGNKASVLVGDYLFAQAFRLMVRTESLTVLEILSEAARIIAEGEVMQLESAFDASIAEDAYLRVIGAKTAELFAAACEVGAVIAGKPEWRLALRRYGQCLGLAFQIADDALDYAAESVTLGKNAGDDFREGKVTLPVILALQQAAEQDRKEFAALFDNSEARNAQAFQHLCDWLKRTGALDAALGKARAYAENAQESLAPLPGGPARDALIEAARFSIERSF